MKRPLVVALSLTASLAWPCATLDHDPERLRSSVKAEEALIVWDPATHTEHFIRSAQFDTDQTDFGFIVPTPSEPELAPVDSAVFETMVANYEDARPRHFEVPWLLGMTLKAASRGAMPSSGVQVLKEQRIGGLDVVVMKASDAISLRAWLEDHQFRVRPAFEKWLTHYVEAGYVFSAFRYTSNGKPVANTALRFSFQTDRPFYPYYEPTDGAPRSGPLVLWLVAPGPMRWDDGKPLEAQPPEIAEQRPPTLNASTSSIGVPPSLAGLIHGQLRAPWVTSYVDDRHVRPAADVTFIETRAEPIEPDARTVTIPIPGELLVVGFIVAAVFATRRGRRARQAKH